jgi:hypothetical protein
MTACAASLAAKAIQDLNFQAKSQQVLLVVWLSSLALNGTSALAEPSQPKNGVPNEVAKFLSKHLEPGDTVQPLDWTGGAVHGMLMARARLATRFMYDFIFYHFPSKPYVVRLRQEFIGELTRSRPKYIIDVYIDKPWPTGANTTRKFPELHEFLATHYVPVQGGATYKILQRMDSISGPQSSHPVVNSQAGAKAITGTPCP